MTIDCGVPATVSLAEILIFMQLIITNYRRNGICKRGRRKEIFQGGQQWIFPGGGKKNCFQGGQQ